MSIERTTDETRDNTGDTTGVPNANPSSYRYGRFVTLAAPSALVALTFAWLNLGATPLRDAILWCSSALLTVSVVILAVAVVRGGDKPRRETYQRAVRTASTTSGHSEGTVPLRLGGMRWQTIRAAGLVVAVPTLLALWVALGVADGRGTGKSAELADAGAVIKSLPITKIENEDRVGSHRTAGGTADFTVMLPSPNGGKSVPATFEANTTRRQGIGSKLDVAYVPDHPELGAIGDDRREDVERQLDGRMVEDDNAEFINVGWGLVALGLVIYWLLTESMRRPARTVDANWKALRVTVTGAGTHIDKPPPTGTTAADEEKQRKNTRTLAGLVLESDGQQIPFHSQMGNKPAAHALSGTHGWLLWHPDKRRTRDTLTELVGDDGWHLPGAVPTDVIQQITKAELPTTPHPDPHRQIRTLDPGAAWLSTVYRPVAIGCVAALASMTPLLLIPDAGTWRWWTAAAGFLAPFLGFAVREYAKEGNDPQAEAH